MKRKKSSHRWLKEHFDDEYVKRAQKDGYRSRAVYKLEEIQNKYHLIKPGMSIVDLGAAPGGWSQLVANIVGSKGRIIANDILPMDSIPFVEFIQGDFREEDVLENMLNVLKQNAKNSINNYQVDVVISDMAPNISGIAAVDQPRSIYLCELALDMAKQILKPRGTFIVKLFQGQGSDDFLQGVKLAFRTVRIKKPKASRSRSREVYVVAQNFQ